MKVAILTPFYPSSILSTEEIKEYGLKTGHPYTWIKNLAEGLVRNDNVEVHVITMCNEFEGNKEFERNGVFYNFIKPSNKYLRVLSLFESDKDRILKFIKKEKFDIVHGQGMNMYGYFSVCCKQPNVITHHLFDEKPLRSFFKYEKISFMSFYNTLLNLYHQKVIMSKSKYIISITPFIRKALESKKKNYIIRDIGNAISASFFYENDSDDEGFALFVGSICERKSVLELLQALKVSGDLNLKIISGTNSGEYFKQVKEYIATNGLKDQVEFVGQLDNDELINVLGKCSFVVLPSKKEGAPMVISEAMAAGKPVVATNVNGIPYMIDDNKTGFLFEVGDIEVMAEKMKLFKNNMNMQHDMKAFAKEKAKNNWHPDIVAKKTLSFYKSIIYSK